MPDNTWKLRRRYRHTPGVYLYGIQLLHRPVRGGRRLLVLALDFGPHCHEITFLGKDKAPCLTKPGKPKWWQGLLCIVVCLALQAFLWALEIWV